jgi:predicted ATPase/DNA-binding SARP family transcriptional activator
LLTRRPFRILCGQTPTGYPTIDSSAAIDASPSSTGLPVCLTPFIGRDRELNDLTRLIGSARLLTLTGAGGSGKTRLAREAALRVAPNYERVAWVDLAPLGDAELLAQLVAASLHAVEHVGVSPAELVTAAVGKDRVLVVLDNCEHLVDACARFAEFLLRACPGVTLLATSREALGVASETAWLVPPLLSEEAVQLFVDRARATLPSFAVTNDSAIRDICRRLDGIPLAIELAAARVRVLSPEQIAQRLDDAFRLLTGGSRTALPRHRTLRATMEWSFGLLSEREQVLLRRLAIFAGSFTLEAAEAVCAGAPLETEDILDGVSALVDKSMVRMEPGDGIARYRLLETVRQYGIERLREAGELTVLERFHADHFLSVLEAAAPHLFGGEEEPGIIARLATDDDNLRAAAAWALRDPSSASRALRFADSLFWYWYGATAAQGRSHFHEARTYVDEAVARGASCEPGLRAGALCSRGLIGLATGDYATANEAFAESLAIVRTLSDPANLAFVLAKYAATRMMSGDLDHAQELLEESSAIVEPMPPSMLHAFVSFWYAWTLTARGDLAKARRLAEAQVTLGYQLGHRTIRGHSHTVFGRVELADGRLDDAFAHFTAALPFHVDLGDGWGLMLDIEGFAAIAARRHRYADAARLLGASDHLRERTIFAIPTTERAQREERLALLRERLGDQFAALIAEGAALSTDEIVRLTADETMAHTAEHPIVLQSHVASPEPGAPAKLRVLALGPLQVMVGDKLIEPSAWGSARPRELLVYLLAHPEGRTKEQVGLAFWPEASTAQLRNNFHVTLHRLRKALGGTSWVTLSGDRYIVDPALVAEFDAAELEREVTSARRALKRQQLGAASQLEQALARYRGDFLDGEPVSDWHIEHRDRLQRLYLEALMQLGDEWSREQRHAKAVDAYRRVLARDELHEEAVRGLMRALADAGERSQALRVYQRFAERLRAELDAEPDDETRELLQRLQEGASSGGAGLSVRA